MKAGMHIDTAVMLIGVVDKTLRRSKSKILASWTVSQRVVNAEEKHTSYPYLYIWTRKQITETMKEYLNNDEEIKTVLSTDKFTGEEKLTTATLIDDANAVITHNALALLSMKAGIKSRANTAKLVLLKKHIFAYFTTNKHAFSAKLLFKKNGKLGNIGSRRVYLLTHIVYVLCDYGTSKMLQKYAKILLTYLISILNELTHRVTRMKRNQDETMEICLSILMCNWALRTNYAMTQVITTMRVVFSDLIKKTTVNSKLSGVCDRVHSALVLLHLIAFFSAHFSKFYAKDL